MKECFDLLSGRCREWYRTSAPIEDCPIPTPTRNTLRGITHPAG